MSIFGQNPADITGAVFKSKNFSDIPDKAAARNNLNVPSKDEVLYNSVPVGMILPYWGSVAPAGYLPCSGQTVTSGTFPELVAFLGGGASQVIPDLRGEFLRGWDNGRGTDLGRAIKTAQADALKNHFHYLPTESGAGPTFDPAGIAPTVVLKDAPADWITRVASDNNLFGTPAGTVRTYSQSADVETRPRNVSVLYCIKAYSSVANYTSSVNIAGLISDYSTLNAAAVKYADFLGTSQIIAPNGYQKYPGGLIIQWGSNNVPNGTTGATFTLPIAFPTSTLTTVTSHPGVTPTINTTGASTINQISLYHSNGANTTAVSWITTGY